MKKIISKVVNFFVKVVFFPFFWKVNQKIVKVSSELEKLKAVRLAWDAGVNNEWENWDEIKEILQGAELEENQLDEIKKIIKAILKSDKKVFLEDDLLEMRASIRKTRKRISELEKEKLGKKDTAEIEGVNELINRYRQTLIDEEKAYTQKQKLFDMLYISGIDIAIKEAELEKYNDQKKAKNKLVIIWCLWFFGTAAISALVASLALFIPFHPKKISFALFCVIFLGGNILALKKNFCEVPYMQEWIMTLFKDYLLVWEPGPHFKFPFFMEIEGNGKGRVYRGNWKNPLKLEGVEMSEGSKCGIDAELWIQIFDAKKAVYNVDDVLASVKDKMSSGVRAFYGNKTIEQAISERSEVDLRKIITQEATEALVFKNWGVKISSLAITNLNLPKEIDEQRIRKLTAEKDLEVAGIDQKKAEVEARTQEIKGEGIGRGLMSTWQKAGGEKEISIREIVDYDKSLKLFDAYGKASLLIATTGSGTTDPSLSGAVAGAAANLGIQAKKQKTEKTKEE